MKPVVRFTLKQSVLINIVFVILVMVGLFSIITIPVENMPTVDMGRVFISTVYFGASADDVEQLVTIKIEDALDGLENVEYIQSSSQRNFSWVEVKFNDDVDYKDLYDELRFRTLNIKDELPTGADEPTFAYLDTHMWMPVIMVNITGDLPHQSLKLYAEDLKTRLMAIPKVRNVAIEGEFEQEFHVSVDPAKLRKFGITFFQVASAIESANTKIPTGRFREGESEFMLDAGRRLRSQEAVLDVVVRRDGDNFIRVRDLVTNARLNYRDPTEIPSVNGEDTLRLKVDKEEDGNAVSIAETVKQVAGEFGRVHASEGIQVVFTNDSTIEINDTINTLGGNLALGMVMVSLILWGTMGWRNAILAAIGIPFSFLCSIVIMYVTGVSLNTISLSAFVLVTGIIVDDAVIILENVYRHIQMGKSKVAAVIDGTGEVMLPVVSAALTTIFAFLPMLIMTGSTGEFFAMVPKTVTYALMASMFEALFILPLHILDFGPKPESESEVTEDEDPFHHLQSGVFAPIWKLYRFWVTRFLNHKYISLAGVTLLFLAAMAILGLSATGVVPLIKVKFFPGNYFRYHVIVDLPVGTALETTDGVVRDLSRHIVGMGREQAQSASGSAGFYEDEDYSHHTGHNYGQIVVTLPEEDIRVFPDNPSNDPMVHLAYMRREIQAYVAANYKNSGMIPKVKIFEEPDGPPAGKDVNIRVTGLTMEQAIGASDAIMAFMRGETDLSGALTDLGDDRPFLHKTVKFIPKQEKIFEYGLSPNQVTGLVAATLNGYHAGDFRTIDQEVNLMVRVARTQDTVNPGHVGLKTPLDILELPVIEHPDAPVLLRDLVDVVYVQEPNNRSRYKGKPTITITADIREGSKLSPAAVGKKVKDFFMADAARFENIAISFGGEFESTQKSFTSLGFAFLIAILLIYMVLGSQFNDYFQPVMIMSAVPFALIGVVMGLFFTRTTFTVTSFMAVVGLAGVAVNNSLLLIEFINVRLRAGRPLRDAIIEGCAARMRPILITTVTTLLGLMPMAIGIPRKSISWAPMATAFVAGLCSATILALLIVPVEYELFERVKARLKGR